MGLTDEQIQAVDLFKTAASLKINAFAGTGKTTTLTALGKSTRNSGVYLAFNKSIAEEARTKFPQSVDCRTTHSLALRSLPGKYRGNNAKLFENVQGNRVAQLLGIEELAVGDVLLKPRALGYLTAKTLQRFCQSADEDVATTHVPLNGKLQLLAPAHRAEFQKYVAHLSAHLWDRMLDPSDEAPLGHDGYLKLWSLSSPEMRYDFILLDEAQDTNEAVLSVLRKQNAQLTLVGDRHQQIYEWRGAVNAMAKVKTASESALTQSFRFGPQIADVAARILRDLGETRTLRGNPAVNSSITTAGEARTVLCRTNAGVIAVVLQALRRNEKPHVIGGVTELVRMLEDVTRLKNQLPAESPELFGFASWEEVVAFAGSDDGESLRSFVTIVNENGELTLIKALKSVAHTESAADLVVSTGHKAKGREWQSVRLHGDFEPKKKSADEKKKPVMNEEEVRLLYVAATRPQVRLIAPSRLAAAWQIPGASEQDETPSPAPVTTIAPRAARPKPDLPSIAKVATAASGQPRMHTAASQPLIQPSPSQPRIQPTPVAPIMSSTDSNHAKAKQATSQDGLLVSIFKSVFGR